MTTESLPSSVLDSIIERGVLFLLIFTPLAFGGVQDWAAAIMEIAAFIILAAWIVKKGNGVERTVSSGGGQGSRVANFLFAGFVLLIILQLVPLPEGLLRLLSPNTSRFYERFSPDGSAAWKTLSIYPWATRQELLKLLAYASVFTVVKNYYRTREQLDGLVRTILLVAISLVVFAVVQKMTWNGRLFWIYPIDAHSEATRNFAVWGPFINRNHFAGYLEMCIPLGLGLVLFGASRAGTSRHDSFTVRLAGLIADKRSAKTGLWAVVVLALTGALFMTLSRGGITGFLCSSLVLIILIHMRRGLKKRIGMLIMMGVALLLTVVVAGWENIEDRFEQLGQESTLKRAEVWTDSVGIVRDYPFFGTGLGTFQNSYPRYQSHSSTVLYDHAHNDYVELLTDTGIIGFIMGVILAITVVVAIFKTWLMKRRTFVMAIGAGGIASLTAIAVHSFTDFNLHIPANAMLLSMIAGLTWAAVFTVGKENGN